jgi:transposase-like protein
MGLEEALSECDTFVSEDDMPWSKIADKHGVVRSTLTRKWRGETRSREEQAVAQQKLTLQQEAELVKYIEELTARRVPPTREMIRNFASAVAQEPVSESWVTRFINRHAIHLISQYSTGMDADRHNADSFVKYKLYFDSLQAKIAEYDVEVENTYNMDEKGFMIGTTTRTKHVFSRRMWEKKEVRETLQDSNRA